MVINLMKRLPSYILVLFTLAVISISSQTLVAQGEFNFELIHARKLNKIQASTRANLKSKELKTVFIKLQMSTKSGVRELFDINRFSLVNETHKLRSRPIDISYQAFTAYMSFNKLTKEPVKSNIGGPVYERNIDDSFEKFSFEGYTVCEVPMDYLSWGKRKNLIIYFKPKKFKSKKLNFFFPFPKSIKKGTLYYGKEKIAEVAFK